MADEERSVVNNTQSTENISISQRCRTIFSRRNLGILFLGQMLSLCLCGTGIFSQLLEQDHHIKTPTTQSFLNYVLLLILFMSQLVYRGGFLEVLKERGWKYLVLGLIDVEANYLVVKAYQYTNLTSIQVLDCFSLPTVLVLSLIFLKVRYKLVHYISVVVCLVGIACLVTADYYGSRYYGPGSNQILGDALVLCGSILYGLSNVSQEFLVKTFSRVEFLAMIGLSGSVVSGIQMAVLERHELSSIEWNYDVAFYFLGFAVCLFLLYTLMPIALKISSAMVVNLSLLTADFYTLLLGLLLFKYKFSPLYFAAFSLVITGLVFYNSKSVPTLPPSNRTYLQLEDENSPQETELNVCC
ncbi:solute carrier family 35 member F1-like [Actinia tenebrosa]|uniref:Solute carrier family 35 member F1-like n=1 Tax=Actinia tenebrosa TaxID=6105 RepID=A0A6P8J446_ACTTE|nr:solute carrier family 35 member F1-like [Actinia tenebrosa]